MEIQEGATNVTGKSFSIVYFHFYSKQINLRYDFFRLGVFNSLPVGHCPKNVCQPISSTNAFKCLDFSFRMYYIEALIRVPEPCKMSSFCYQLTNESTAKADFTISFLGTTLVANPVTRKRRLTMMRRMLLPKFPVFSPTATGQPQKLRGRTAQPATLRLSA